MTQRRTTFETQSTEKNVTGQRPPRAQQVNIKDKISQWEGKESTQMLKKTQSLKKNDARPIEELKGEDSRRVATNENPKTGKENVEEQMDSHPSIPCPPDEPAKPKDTPKKGNDKRTFKTIDQEKSAVFSLFRKLEQTMGESTQGQAPLELPGNYFCPFSKDKQVDVKRRELASTTGTKLAGQDQENVYTEPGAPAINPVPKPQRTFQHPHTSVGKTSALRQGRDRRNLPPLPSISPPPLASHPLHGLDRRPRADRHRDNRKYFECEELATSHNMSTSPMLSRRLSQEHHYEDIHDGAKENPYEDIDLDSQCSQQSLPSSPGPESGKSCRPGFFRQNSGKISFKLLELRKANHHHRNPSSSSGVASPLQLSPSSTPTSPELSDWLPGDPCRRIPTVVLKINSIFESRVGKKRLKRVYHYAETSSGRVTDDNSDSESEVEERAKAQRRRLVSVKSVLIQSGSDQRQAGNTLLLRERSKELHQRQLFEYFLVVALQKAKAGGPYVPEVSQQFPLKLERSFKFMRETEDQLRIIPQFCFPDAKHWEPVDSYPSEMFSFVLTGEDGSRRFGYCRRLLPSGKEKRLPEVYCIVSHLGCFNLFSKVLDEVERRRALSPALVQPFMRAIMEAQFPAPGRTITIKTFLPGSGTELIELCRPSDSRLEHVDFECLFSCLSLRLLLRVLGSLLLERRVIFTADKLSTLSQCCHAVVALLYPFVWQHTYIPVLPTAMLDIVCTPTPFIVGLLTSSLAQLTELPLEEVLVVDLEKNRFLRQLDDEDSILPSKLQSALENVLERRRELANERGGDLPNDSGHLSTVVSEAFVRFFVELVGHYPLFIFAEREDGYSSSSSSPASSSFQRERFRKSVPSKSMRRFLEVFMGTQMFGSFIQEREHHRQALRGLFEVRVQEYLDSIHDNENRRVNRFLKGLGNKMKFLSKK
ncbi:DENN domain-containing protein 2A [Aplochiton taeniatus]